MSYAAFVAPHTDVEVEPLVQMLGTQQSHRMYKKIKYGDYLKEEFQRKLDGKAHIARYTV